MPPASYQWASPFTLAYSGNQYTRKRIAKALSLLPLRQGHATIESQKIAMDRTPRCLAVPQGHRHRELR